MVPDSRGSAATLVVLVAAAGFLGSVWLAFGMSDPSLSDKLVRIEDARAAGPTGSEGLALLGEADALSTTLSGRKGAVAVPQGLALHRPGEKTSAPATPEPPGVASLAGGLEAGEIVLRWSGTGGPSGGYRVERLGEAGIVVATSPDLDPDAREYRDGPPDAIAGERTYRVTALDRAGSRAGAGHVRVPFRARVDVAFLGAGSSGSGRFRVAWERGSEALTEVFPVAPGRQIGGPVDGKPPLDWSTGWRFVSLRLSRTSVPQEVSVPRFTPEGPVVRDPDSGEPVVEQKTAAVPVVGEGAVVTSPDAPGEEIWLPKVKD